MITVAREADLQLSEYEAFRSRQTLPQMRRWEMPFALFQARLPNNASVLDCTLNPVNFRKRLACLYRQVRYQHWCPIQQGQFVLPEGMPDAAFDRVICINTLEHLLQEQREALVAAMARTLKPGGLLVLTSDYYFERFWQDPAFLQAGVMRADGEEVFNGWNKVTPREWLVMGRQHGLHPLAETVEEPREEDPTLYRHQPPYPHACIGGVFYKGPRADLPAGKKMLLALLTWNTRAVSLDSVRAYVREAQMLQRLGQVPLLCICDNGSTDGTAEALRTLAQEIDVPCRLILNEENQGNCIARNQIIDYMLESEADYLLFMDGDIEVVPFSSYAMLRYIEDQGSRLGCIGADFNGFSPHRERASACWYCIDDDRIETSTQIAWTQYGLFRRAVFDAGVRFDETEPFDGVGWGFEDIDLAFQIGRKGFLNQRFFGMVYLHRAYHSSVRIMRQLGLDPEMLRLRRKQYLVDKWSSTKPIDDALADGVFFPGALCTCPMAGPLKHVFLPASICSQCGPVGKKNRRQGP